jgi:hypothetical protein
MTNQVVPLLAFLLLLTITLTVKLDKGQLQLQILTGDLSSEIQKVDIFSQLKQTLNLTQSSRLSINSKVNITTLS